MKTLITNLAVAGTIALLLIVACTREIPVEVPATVVVTVETEKRVLVPVMTKVPVTVEVPVEVTREVTVEKRIPVKHEVEVTREVPVEVTREVHVEKRVLVTYDVEVDREVPVTVEVIATREVPATVEVTREVEVPATVEVTREVPIEVTRIVEVTREVEVPATVEVTREVPVEVTRTVEVAREVEVVVTAAALGVTVGAREVLPAKPIGQPNLYVRHDYIECNGERIDFYFDRNSIDRRMQSETSCILGEGTQYDYYSKCHARHNSGRPSEGVDIEIRLKEPYSARDEFMPWRQYGSLDIGVPNYWSDGLGINLPATFIRGAKYTVDYTTRHPCTEFEAWLYIR